MAKNRKIKCRNCGKVREVTVTSTTKRRETKSLGRRKKQITYDTEENWNPGVCKKCGSIEYDFINPNDNDEPKTAD